MEQVKIPATQPKERQTLLRQRSLPNTLLVHDTTILRLNVKGILKTYLSSEKLQAPSSGSIS